MIRRPRISPLFPYTTLSRSLHAQDALGDVVFVDLPAVGTSFNQGDVAGVVESVKAAADVYMPGRKSTRLNSSHTVISYAVFCLKKKKNNSNNKGVGGIDTPR